MDLELKKKKMSDQQAANQEQSVIDNEVEIKGIKRSHNESNAIINGESNTSSSKTEGNDEEQPTKKRYAN